jgi:hypothetical protein
MKAVFFVVMKMKKQQKTKRKKTMKMTRTS